MNGIRQWQESSMELRQEQLLARRHYVKEAAKAFKLFECKQGVFYTCNVARLHECNRLGEDKEVRIWQTYLFIQSKSFQTVSGVIYNTRPGTELAKLSKERGDTIYLAMDARTILNTANGDRTVLDQDIIFASTEEE